MTPIGSALAELAADDPDRPAVTTSTGTLTRQELEHRTNRLARAYLERGVTPDSFVTILLPTGSAYLEAVVATWKAGATPQPVSHRLPERELREIIELADPSLVVGADVPGRNALPTDWSPPEDTSAEPLPPMIARSLKAPTSGGSTGRPKLIVSTEPATAESLRSFAALVRLRQDGTVLSTGPLSHNGPLFTNVAALLLGCHVVVMERFDAAQTLALVERHGVDWMYSVPTMLRRIQDLPEDVLAAADVSSLRTVITMAAACSPSLRTFCLDYFGPDVMVELYAATEAHAVTITDGHGWLSHPGSVGRPVVGEIEARGPDGSTLPAGEVGELWMRRSPQEAGPYRYVGAEPQRSKDGWETVGDLGHLDADGFLHLADRKTDMIVVGGSNVYPAEVEAALEEHPDVQAASVVGLPDDEYGNRIHAVLNVRGPVSDEELLTHLRAAVAPYKLPRTFERTSEPLRDEAGKTRRSRVREHALARSTTDTRNIHD
ncbi:AMP-binding protein [Nocardioides sp. QY071]|uniref:AMP-binding protein n=1 Tax=Nocardioides sp. QY071 TaxID=3044187 RepID=UPI00249CCACA|nr:AMP-binding protein [Nocardioides sp. QY071]WGY00425.1 AMP-binding protein [Nocardioides sp. QY071]